MIKYINYYYKLHFGTILKIIKCIVTIQSSLFVEAELYQERQQVMDKDITAIIEAKQVYDIISFITNKK